MSAVPDPLQAFEAALRDGLPDRATGIARDAIAAGRGGLPLRFRLIATLLKQGSYRDAYDLTSQSARLTPQSPAELVELAKRLMYFNMAEELRNVALQVLARPLGHPGAEADFAALLSMSGEQELAGRLLKRATTVVGDAPGVLYNRSQIELYSGRMDSARSLLRQCLRADPTDAKAFWALSKLPPGDSKQALSDVAAMTRLASKVAPGSQQEAYLRFALFNVLDRIAQPAEAWMHLSRGMQVKRGLLNYDAAASSTLFSALESAFSTVQPELARRMAADAPTPIFIVGMHRSGTTLLERLLGNHSAVREGGELYDFPAQLRWGASRHFSGACDAGMVADSQGLDLPLLGRRYIERVSWRAGDGSFLVDKLPSNFLNIGFIRQALPQARVIHMTRHPMDTCFSNLKELFSNACAYSYDADELADFYSGYTRLMRHWHQVAPGFVLDVSYEQLIRDPRGEAERVLAFCGLEWEEACGDTGANDRTVNTASSAQVREPIHQRSVQAWRRYEAQLRPLGARLGKHGLGPAVT